MNQIGTWSGGLLTQAERNWTRQQQEVVDMTALFAWRGLGLGATAATRLHAARISPAQVEEMDFVGLERLLQGRGVYDLFWVIMEVATS